jgi:hypothetical protein
MSFTALQQLVEQYGCTLPPPTIVHLLKRLVGTPDGSTSAKRILMHQLCLYLWPEMEQRDLKELIHIVASCSKLGYPVARFYFRCLTLARKRIGAGAEVTLVANFISAFANAPAGVIRERREEAVREFVRIFIDRSKSASPKDISQVLVAAAKAKVQLQKKGAEKLVLMLLKHVDRASPLTIGSCLWALGSMGGQGVQEKDVLRLLEVLVSNVSSVSAYVISSATSGAAELGVKVPKKLLQQLSNRMVQTAGQAQTRFLISFLMALWKMGQLELLQQVTDELVTRRLELSPRSIGGICYVLGRLGQKSGLQAEHLHLLVEAFVSKIQDATPASISSAIWGVAAMGQKLPEEQLDQLLDGMVMKLEGSGDLQVISNTFWGLATMGVEQLAPEQLLRLLDCFCSNLADADGEQIAAVLWGVVCVTGSWAPDARREFLTDFTSKVARLKPGTIAATVWEYGKLRHAFLPAAKLEQLLEGLNNQLADADPQDLANAAWGVAKVATRVPEQQLLKMIAGFADKLEAAEPRCIACVLWAVAKLEPPLYPAALVTSKAVRVILGKLPDMTPRELTSIAWGCGRLGLRHVRLLTEVYQIAVAKLAPEAAKAAAAAGVITAAGMDFSELDLTNLCWAAAVLDLQHLSREVQQLAAAFSSRREQQGEQYQVQMYQVHVWLKDCGLAGCLSSKQQVGYSRAWRAGLAEAEDASQMHQAVFAAALRLRGLREPPMLEARTDDGYLSIDISAVTSADVRVAIEVDGHHSHFTLPNKVPTGTTCWRNRALAARGHVVVSVPYWEWDKVGPKGLPAQVAYLSGKVKQGVAEAAKKTTTKEKSARQAVVEEAKGKASPRSKAAAADKALEAKAGAPGAKAAVKLRGKKAGGARAARGDVKPGLMRKTAAALGGRAAIKEVKPGAVEAAEGGVRKTSKLEQEIDSEKQKRKGGSDQKHTQQVTAAAKQVGMKKNPAAAAVPAEKENTRKSAAAAGSQLGKKKSHTAAAAATTQLGEKKAAAAAVMQAGMKKQQKKAAAADMQAGKKQKTAAAVAQVGKKKPAAAAAAMQMGKQKNKKATIAANAGRQ